MAKKWKITATEKMPPGATLQIGVARCGNFGKVKDPLTGKMVDGLDQAGLVELAPGQSVEVEHVEYPERFDHAVAAGYAVVEKLGADKPK